MAYQKINIGDTIYGKGSGLRYKVLAYFDEHCKFLLEGGRQRALDWPKYMALPDGPEFEMLKTTNARCDWDYSSSVEDSCNYDIVEKAVPVINTDIPGPVQIGDTVCDLNDDGDPVNDFVVVCTYDDGQAYLLEGKEYGQNAASIFLNNEFQYDKKLHDHLKKLASKGALIDWEYAAVINDLLCYKIISRPDKAPIPIQVHDIIKLFIVTGSDGRLTPAVFSTEPAAREYVRSHLNAHNNEHWDWAADRYWENDSSYSVEIIEADNKI